MYLAQGHNAVTPVRFKPPQSRDKHYTTEPLRMDWMLLYLKYCIFLIAIKMLHASLLGCNMLLSLKGTMLFSIRMLHFLSLKLYKL